MRFVYFAGHGTGIATIATSRRSPFHPHASTTPLVSARQPLQPADPVLPVLREPCALDVVEIRSQLDRLPCRRPVSEADSSRRLLPRLRLDECERCVVSLDVALVLSELGLESSDLTIESRLTTYAATSARRT